MAMAFATYPALAIRQPDSPPTLITVEGLRSETLGRYYRRRWTTDTTCDESRK